MRKKKWGAGTVPLSWKVNFLGPAGSSKFSVALLCACEGSEWEPWSPQPRVLGLGLLQSKFLAVPWAPCSTVASGAAGWEYWGAELALLFLLPSQWMPLDGGGGDSTEATQAENQSHVLLGYLTTIPSAFLCSWENTLLKILSTNSIEYTEISS